ncbi:penicillin-binding protein 1A [Polymorphobacter multimanifer]|uniref:Penicillin-binding protein 1A n=1 Tax=Polymorphobacter multimanifer TaxID=1070431 RepID=A0A841L4X1_9SPHN|nr:penicillin-binding protein 1A [Polymorphobacter multimanifer]
MSRPPSRRSPAPQRSFPARLLTGVLQAGLVVGLMGLIALVIGVAISYAGLPDYDTLQRSPNGQSIEVRAADNSVLVSLGPSYGEWMPHEAIPDSMKNAIVAIEDKRFRMHPGVDPIGMSRSFVANMQSGRKGQGGSTITQQLARNLFLTSTKTFARKGREIILALALERKFSKDAILELYLNRAYFGGGAYGIDAASRKFFGHPATRLSTAEAAIIAGLVQAPSRYAPSANADAARRRARTVLAVMVNTGALSAAEAEAADPLSVPFVGQSRQAGARWFTDWVIGQLDELIDEPFAPLQVRTTLDPRLQAAAEAAIAAEAPKGSEGALLAVARDGSVKAMVGGRDYVRSNYNRAVTARRQPGSAFKLFVYAAAFEAGLTPEDVVEDKPITIGTWSPRNFNRRFLGPLTLRQAFAQSTNTVAVALAAQVGFDAVADMARRFGITTPIDRRPAMALGASDVTLMELTQSYATVANNGTEARPFGITRVSTGDGAILYERDNESGRVVVAPVIAARLTQVMQAAVESGTGRAAQIGRPLAGKTGTTSSSKDGWFLGFTTSLTTGVWMGRDDARAVPGLGGGLAPARAFAQFMARAVGGTPPEALNTEIIGSDDPYLIEPDAEVYGLSPEDAPYQTEPYEVAPDPALDNPRLDSEWLERAVNQ